MTHTPKVVTFSGIDGAGKTTQIACLSSHLIDRGLRVTRVTFWDDVAVLSRLRAGFSLTALKPDRGQPRTSPLRRDKNVQTWYLTLARSPLYVLDCLSLRRVVSRLRRTDADIIIFDRYVYDQIVQVRARHWVARLFLRFLIALTPRPDAAFVLDACPDDAFARKPEYPLAFMQHYRRAFLSVRTFAPGLTVIAPGAVESVHEQIVALVLHMC